MIKLKYRVPCKKKKKLKLLGGGGLVAKSCWTLAIQLSVACQAPLSMGFSRQDYLNLNYYNKPLNVPFLDPYPQLWF